MSKIWLTSDWHFGHDREFIWKPRGFHSIQEMNAAILERHNSVVSDDDDVYVLGDLMLGDNQVGLRYIQQLKGHLHIILGNHDTKTRIALYEALPNVELVCDAFRLDYKKYHFYMSHFPTLTGNLEAESLHKMTLNLFGHTHSAERFYEDRPYMYNVAVDAHDCYPVDLDEIIREMREKVDECLRFLEAPASMPVQELLMPATADGLKSVFVNPQPISNVIEKVQMENMKQFTSLNCEKCVWSNECKPIAEPAAHCPPGYTYKRDPPDGGYYG